MKRWMAVLLAAWGFGLLAACSAGTDLPVATSTSSVALYDTKIADARWLDSDHSYHTYFSFTVLAAKWPVGIKATLLPAGVKFTTTPVTTLSAQGGVRGDFSYGPNVAPILDVLVTDTSGQSEKIHQELKANPVAPHMAPAPRVGLTYKQTSGNRNGCVYVLSTFVANTFNQGKDWYKVQWSPTNLGSGWDATATVPVQGMTVAATVTPMSDGPVAGTLPGTADPVVLRCS